MTRAEGSQGPTRVPLVRASGTRVDVYPRPPEGWSGPDTRGIVRFTIHDSRPFGWSPPAREGYELFFVAVHGQNYTTWAYKEVTR